MSYMIIDFLPSCIQNKIQFKRSGQLFLNVTVGNRFERFHFPYKIPYGSQ